MLCKKEEMTIYRAKLNKEKLLKLSEEERNLFISIAHLQNEIRFSLYGVVWTGDGNSQNEAVIQSQLAFRFYYLRILAGKLHEGWQLVQKHFYSNKTLSQEFKTTAKEKSRNALSDLNKYFSKKNAISAIRNNFSFHFNPSDLAKPLNEMKDDLDLYISKGNDANTLYYFAEALASWAIISKIDNPDNKNPIELVYEELTSVAKLFNKFNQFYMSFVLSKYKTEIWESTTEEVKIENLIQFKDVKIPFFTDTKDGFI